MADTAESFTDRRPWVLLSPALTAVTFLLLIPILFVIVYSFWLRTSVGDEQVGFYLDNWQKVLGDPFYRDILIQTLRIAAVSTLFCIVMGYVPAYFLAYADVRHKVLLILLLMLPFWISYIIRTMSWIHVLGASGIVNTVLQWFGIIGEPLQMLYNEASVVLGLVHFLLPFMVLNIYVSLDGIDRNLTDAAKSLGCTGWQAFREVTLPLSLPGLGAGTILCFVLAAGTYITPIVLGGSGDTMFANLVFEAIITQLNWPLGSALSLVLLVLLGALVMIYTRYLGVDQIAKSFR
ncbi:MAG: ABC transporter permease [Halofilum sp. (in: g-proteobacteria)]